MPGSRSAALALMGMLVFGFLVGGLAAGQSIQNLANAPLVVLHLGGSHQANSGNGSGGGGGFGGGGGSGAGQQNQQTQTQTQTQAQTNTTPTSTTTTPTTPSGFNGLPPIQHVFLVVFSGQGYSQTFSSASPHRYWSNTLVSKGELLINYYSVAAGSLANEIAMLSGQGPTPQTVADCPVYAKVTPGSKGPRGQVIGSGCVYPSHTKALMSQLTSAHDTWKAYVDGISSGQACGHPQLGGRAKTPTLKHPYDPWTNPFVYFDSVTGASRCAKNDVGLGRLKTDLRSAATTPSFSYIAPSPCEDGSDTPCAPNAPAGIAPAERFLKRILSQIESSPAYKSGGLIAITFDQAAQTGPNADSSSCCIFPKYPNLPASTTPTGTGTTPTGTTTPSTTPTTTTNTNTTPSTTDTSSTTPTTSTTTTTTTPTTPGAGGGTTSPTGGGGQVGMLLISKWVKAGTNDTLDYFNHFSLLASVESLFGLRHLGYAAAPSLQSIPAADFSGKGP